MSEFDLRIRRMEYLNDRELRTVSTRLEFRKGNRLRAIYHTLFGNYETLLDSLAAQRVIESRNGNMR